MSLNSGHVMMVESSNSIGSSIEAFFADAVVLITGATGFLGKALLEKLLRSCACLSAVIVLIRPKKGQTVEQRFNELINNPVFDRIRWECPEALNKVHAVKGDVSQAELGLSVEDREMLLQRVNIVFHGAATVRFDEPLKVAVNLNTSGTDRIIDLCRDMANLVSFVHVSTAYSNADKFEIKEKVYTTKVRPQTVIEMTENLDDETMRILEKKLIGKHPNTYTMTKGLAEQVIRTKAVGLPVSIVRPSIVCAAYQEPFPGWVDNVCGITGIMMEIGRGTMRSIVCKSSYGVDVVPIDYVVNTLICVAWYNATHPRNEVQVYNCTSGAFNAITWGEFGSLTRKHAIESPTKYVMWYPGFTFRTNRLIHKFVVATCHYLPAFVVDLAIRFKGGKPMMVKMTKRFERAAKTGEFFAINEWQFRAENMMELMRSVKDTSDSKTFNVDIASMDWDSYLHQYMLGIRKYILKDSPDTLTKARNRLFKLYLMHKITQILAIVLLTRTLIRARR